MFKILKKILSKALPIELHNIVEEYIYEPITESQLKWCKIFENTSCLIEDCRICENCNEIKSNKKLNEFFCSDLCYNQFLYHESLRVQSLR
jgi:hypothetical protein